MSATGKRRMLPTLDFSFRDDQKVAEALFNREMVDSVHPFSKTWTSAELSLDPTRLSTVTARFSRQKPLSEDSS
ncbi:MAG: hypothetical protein VB144_05090 [Clostridia bacterium]|nr:hypothetical protein [Clostridia bacterium]